MSSTKAWSVRSEQLLRSGNLSKLTLWWVTTDLLVKATSTPGSKSLMYKKEKNTKSSPIMWHRYVKLTIRWFRLSTNRCRDWRGQPQRGFEGEHLAQCAHVRRCKEEHMLAERRNLVPSYCLMIAFITWNSNLVPLLEGLCSSDTCRFEFSFFLSFGRNWTDNLGMDIPASWPTKLVLHCLGCCVLQYS